MTYLVMISNHFKCGLTQQFIDRLHSAFGDKAPSKIIIYLLLMSRNNLILQKFKTNTHILRLFLFKVRSVTTLIPHLFATFSYTFQLVQYIMAVLT